MNWPANGSGECEQSFLPVDDLKSELKVEPPENHEGSIGVIYDSLIFVSFQALIFTSLKLCLMKKST